MILTDSNGKFWNPDCLASYAFFVERRLLSVGLAARQMIERGGVEAARARDWLRRRQLTEADTATEAGIRRISVIAAETVGC